MVIQVRYGWEEVDSDLKTKCEFILYEELFLNAEISL